MSQITKRLLPAPTHLMQNVIIIATLIMVWLGAHILYHYIEEPARRYLRNKANKFSLVPNMYSKPKETH